MAFFEHVERSITPNGVEVITDYHAGHGLTSGALVIASGSFHETGLSGAFHYLEHLIPCSHPVITKQQFADEAHAMAIAHELSTSHDTIQIRASGGTDEVRSYFDMTVAMVGHGGFRPHHVEEDRPAIHGEMRGIMSSRGAQHNIARLEAFFGADTPASRIIGGNPDDLLRIDYGHLRALRNAHVVGKNLVFVTAGGMSHREAFQMAHDYLGHLPAGSRYPRYGGRMLLSDCLLPTKEGQNNTVLIGLAFDASRIYAGHTKRMALIRDFLSKVLFDELRLKQGEVYGAYADVDVANTREAALAIRTVDAIPLEQFQTYIDGVKGILQDICAGSDRFKNTFELTKTRVRSSLKQHKINLRYSMDLRCGRLIDQTLVNGKLPDPEADMRQIENIGYEEVLGLIADVVKSSRMAVEYTGHVEGLPRGHEMRAYLDFGGGGLIARGVRLRPVITGRAVA